MNNMKAKISEVLADLLIKQAESGIKHSPAPIISEAEFPVELMMEDAE